MPSSSTPLSSAVYRPSSFSTTKAVTDVGADKGSTTGAKLASSQQQQQQQLFSSSTSRSSSNKINISMQRSRPVAPSSPSSSTVSRPPPPPPSSFLSSSPSSSSLSSTMPSHNSTQKRTGQSSTKALAVPSQHKQDVGTRGGGKPRPASAPATPNHSSRPCTFSVPVSPASRAISPHNAPHHAVPFGLAISVTSPSPPGSGQASPRLPPPRSKNSIPYSKASARPPITLSSTELRRSTDGVPRLSSSTELRRSTDSVLRPLTTELRRSTGSVPRPFTTELRRSTDSVPKRSAEIRRPGPSTESRISTDGERKGVISHAA